MGASIDRAVQNGPVAVQVGQDSTQLIQERALREAALRLSIQEFSIRPEGDKLLVTGRARYALDRDMFWDAVKEIDGWETAIVVTLDVERTDVRGFHVVEPGETLAMIAERHLGSAERQMEIFEANRDRMNSPDQILSGQPLLIPRR